MTRTWVVWATVTRWIDGDTFVADLDLGWNVWRHDARVRLLDIDAPERGRTGFAEARDAAETLCPVGTVVQLTSHRLDSFGRVLASVTLPDGRDLVSVLREQA